MAPSGTPTIFPRPVDGGTRSHHCDSARHTSGAAELWAELCEAKRQIAELEVVVNAARAWRNMVRGAHVYTKACHDLASAVDALDGMTPPESKEPL